ncbi:MAG: Fe-S-containing protein [Propionivibrio sp.]
MSLFFSLVLQSFLLPALLLGGHWSARRTPSAARLAVATVAVLAVGCTLGAAWPAGQVFALGAATVQIAILLLLAAANGLPGRPLSLSIHLLLITAAAFRWGQNPQLKTITPTGIVNSDLILNVAAIVGAFLVLALLAFLLASMDRRQPRWRKPFMALFILLMLVPLSGELLLALVKLQVLPLTRGWISVIARATEFSGLLIYAALALLLSRLALYAVGEMWPRRRIMLRESQAIPRRQAIAQYRDTRRVFLGAAILAPLAGSVHWYWKSIASRPPPLSPATPVTLDADGVLRLPVAAVRDGHLHRFAWVAEDGKLVRFFAINRYPDKLSLAAVFDACQLCGDQGYAEQGDQVTCSACGVYLFKPSIGKPGGCNPVPIEGWQLDGDMLAIPRAALEAGRSLFTTVVELMVSDPVDGSRLTNTTAKYSYTFDSNTYFFNDQAHYEAFREAPEKYLEER